MNSLLALLPELEQGKTLFCPNWHTYLRPIGNGEVERTQYLMEGEWAKPRTLNIEALKQTILQHEQHLEKQRANHAKDREELKSYNIILPFGKHRGKHLSEVPSDYLDWLSQQNWENEFPKNAMNYSRLHSALELGDDYDEDLDFAWEVEGK